MLWFLAIGAAAALFLRRRPAADAVTLPSPWTWERLSPTTTGLDNTPDDAARVNLARITERVLEPLRRRHPTIVVTSGYRSAAVNRAVGGSTTSDHPKGNAVDIVVPGLTSRELAESVLASGVPYDQIVWYDRSNHVHVGLRSRNRSQVLRYDGTSYRKEGPDVR